jgi:tetratricopeptide (TPR) repeat protein
MLQDHPALILARLVATLTSSDPTELTALTEVQPASADEAAALQRICHAQDPLQPALEHALPVGPLEQFAAGLVALRESRGGNLYHYLGHEEHSLRQAVGFLANAILLAPESELLFYFTYANAVRALLLVDPEWAAPECARVAIALQTLWPDSAAALYSAAACMKATDLEHSAELYRRCVALDPHDVNSMLSLAWFELVHQDLDAAQDWYQRASRSLQITQRPLAWMQHRGYAKMLLSTGHPQAALRPLTRALELCPADLTSRALQGRVLLELDRADEAATELQTAVELQQRGTTDGYPVDLVPLELPTDLARADVAVHILLGMAHMRSQRAREAHVPLQTAVEMDPNSACASRWLRRALVQLADLDGHADELQRWIQINPADLHCVHELAKILIQRGHQEEAWLTLDQALEQASAEADENLLEELVALQSKLDHESIATVRQRLINGMLSYLQADEDAPADSDCGYTQAEIDECASIVDGYLTALPGSGNDRIMQLIREAVIRLNELNDRCGFALIETDQREDLCEIILVAARDAGLATSDDVTEEWREW